MSIINNLLQFGMIVAGPPYHPTTLTDEAGERIERDRFGRCTAARQTDRANGAKMSVNRGESAVADLVAIPRRSRLRRTCDRFFARPEPLTPSPARHYRRIVTYDRRRRGNTESQGGSKLVLARER